MSFNVAISHVFGYKSKTVLDKVSFLIENGFYVIGPKKISNHFSQYSINQSSGNIVFRRTIGNPMSGTKFIFLSRRLLLNRKTKTILVESEPWSIVFLQVLFSKLLFAPQASISLFTWENFIRKGIKGQLLKIFYKLAIRNCTNIICGNHAGKLIFQLYGAQANQLHILPQFGVNPKDFAPCPMNIKQKRREQYLGNNKEKFVIGFAGRLVTEKGILDLKQAFEKLYYYNKKVHLLILGNGPLRNKINNIDGITIIEAVNQNDVPNFLSIMDLFVLPSKSTEFWIEQFGRVLIEAMSCGIPVLGSDSGEIPFVISNDLCIFKEGDIDAIFELLNRLSSDKKFYESIKVSQQEHVKAFYNEEVYKNLLKIIKANNSK